MEWHSRALCRGVNIMHAESSSMALAKGQQRAQKRHSKKACKEPSKDTTFRPAKS
jgi:hypothetical protein